MLAERGLEHIGFHIDLRGQEWFQDVVHLRVNHLLVSLCVLFLGPQTDRDPLLLLQLFRDERKNLKEANLLFQDGKNFGLNNFYEQQYR